MKIKTLSVDTVFGVGPEGTLINSLNVSDINANAVLTLGGSYIMTGIKTFTNGLTADGLKVTGG